MTVITQDIAAKVLATIDAGLVDGVGEPAPGKMCVEAAICYALGQPQHSDDPQCVSRPVRELSIHLNDQAWSSPDARAKGLRRLGIAQLGTRDTIDDEDFARRVVELVIRKYVPMALRAAASIHKDKASRAALLDAANRCESESTKTAADAAYAAAAKAAKAATAAYAVAAKAAEAAKAAKAAKAAAVAVTAAYAGAEAAEAAEAAAEAAAAVAVDAAVAAVAEAAAAKTTASDTLLSDFAEDVVQILIGMNAPGCRFLDLTSMAASLWTVEP